mmetsp:Transcript_8898/g.19044  ORF Transcript_8898/g.19044 Transcript_8898/m.19044 type:complete len:428 (-) Transcript_8898:208-1491(-)
MTTSNQRRTHLLITLSAKLAFALHTSSVTSFISALTPSPLPLPSWRTGSLKYQSQLISVSEFSAIKKNYSRRPYAPNYRTFTQQSKLQLVNNSNSNRGSDTNKSSNPAPTRKANVRLTQTNEIYASNQLSPLDAFLLNLTSDRTSLLLGSLGILILFVNRFVSFPDPGLENGGIAVDAGSFSVWEASRSRVDLLGVFAAGSVLLNGITKLDVTSVEAERVVLEGIRLEGVFWNEGEMQKVVSGEENENESIAFRSTVEWALSSFVKCSPAQTAVLLTTTTNNHWTPLAMAGVAPSNPTQRISIPSNVVSSTPILDRMLSSRQKAGNIQGGTVAGSKVSSSSKERIGSESYLPTLQALPGRVEFTYLPGNAQEALVLPVLVNHESDEGDDKRQFAIVLGGDKAKSFSPRDVAWCREIAAWIGESVMEH